MSGEPTHCGGGVGELAPARCPGGIWRRGVGSRGGCCYSSGSSQEIQKGEHLAIVIFYLVYFPLKMHDASQVQSNENETQAEEDYCIIPSGVCPVTVFAQMTSWGDVRVYVSMTTNSIFGRSGLGLTLIDLLDSSRT